METWDVYDCNGVKTGRTHIRGEELKEGDYHVVVHVWMVNDQDELLIQKRQPWKKGFPDMWDCTAAGAAIVGDDSKQAAIRETKEEIGIDLNIMDAKRLFTIDFSCGFDDVYFVRQSVDLDDLKLQFEEVADAKWVTITKLKQMVASGEFINYHYLDQIITEINSKKRSENK